MADVEERPEELADRLADETARLAGQLAFAVDHSRVRTRFALSGQPVAVTFRKPADQALKPLHRSGSLAPELLPFLVDATLRARDRLQWAEDEDSPYLIPLVLACFYVIEGLRTNALGLGDFARGTPLVKVLTEEEGLRDIMGVPGGMALRVLCPVESDAGVELTAAIELTWLRAAR